MLAIYRKDALEGGERYREDYDFDLESSALELRGGSGMLGKRMRIRMISSSRPSGGVVLLRNLTLTYYSAVIDIWVSFVTVFFVKYL